MAYTYENLIIGGQSFDSFFEESGMDYGTNYDLYFVAYDEWQKNHVDWLDIEGDGQTANGLIVNGQYWSDGYWDGTEGYVYIYGQNVKLYNTTVNGGEMDLGRNNYATGITINGGRVSAVNKTVVTDAVVNGGVLRLSSSVGRGITVNGGTLELAYYAVLEGTTNIAEGAKLITDHEADTLAPTNQGTINIALATIDDIADTAIQVSRIGGTGTINITVAAELEEGVYTLVFDNDPWDLMLSEDFNEVVNFVGNTNTINLIVGGYVLGDVRSIDKTVSIGGYDYTLSSTYYSEEDFGASLGSGSLYMGKWHSDEITGESTWIGNLSGINLTVKESEVVGPDGVNLISTKSKVSQYNLSLGWNKAVPVDASTKITSYEVEVNGTIYSTKSTSYTLKNLELGNYDCRIRAIDSTGTAGAWGDLKSFTVVDITPPSVKNFKVTVEGYSLGLSWIGEDKKGEIVSYTVKLDGEIWNVLDDNVSSVALELSEAYVGKHKVEIIAFDGVNYGKAVSKTVTVKDATPPEQVTGLVIPSVNSKYQAALSWDVGVDNSGKVARYEILLDSGKILKSTKNSLIVSKLSVGEHTYQVRAIDRDNNVGEWSTGRTFTVKDMTAPTSVKGKAIVTGYSVSFELSGKDNSGKIAKYIVSCGDKVVETNSASAVLDGFGLGKHLATVVAYDAEGNFSKETKVSFTVKDVTAPDQVIGLSSPGVQDKSYKANLSWQAAVDNSGKIAQYEIMLDGKLYRSSKPTLTTAKLAVGEHTYQVRAIDQAKNVGEWSDMQTFTVSDVTAPDKVAAKAKVTDNWVGIEWKETKDNVGVVSYEVWFGESKDSMSLEYQLEAGQFSCDFSGIDKGNWYYGVVAIDAAGNRSTMSTSKLTVKTELAATELSMLSAYAPETLPVGLLA